MSMRAFKLFSLLLMFLLFFPNGILSKNGSTSAITLEKINRDDLDKDSHLGDDDIVYIDMRDYGLDPRTTFAVSGQRVVWMNNGTMNHTITEGEPIYSSYLPLTMSGNFTSSVLHIPLTDIKLGMDTIFYSDVLEPGDQFNFTFNNPGDYSYYSKTSPGSVEGRLIVSESGETVVETLEANASTTISTITGASIEIDAGVLLTDTIASITEIPGLVFTDTTGTPVGSIYDFEIVQFDDVISGHVTVNLPFDPNLLPPEGDEEELNAYYFNGLRWVNIGGQVDSINHRVVFSSTHLSDYVVQLSCEHPFDLTGDQEIAFDRAAVHFLDITQAEDLFNEFITSDNQPIFGVNYENARWLANITLCELANLSKANIPMDKTPEEIVSLMVNLGEIILSIGDEIGDAQTIINELEDASHALLLFDIALGHPAVFLAKTVLYDIAFFALLNTNLLLDYVGELEDKADILDIWLQQAYEVGESDMTSVSANAMVSEPPGLITSRCNTYDWKADGIFYNYQVVGGSTVDYIDDTPEISEAYANIYQVSENAYFVLGLQSLLPFREHVDAGFPQFTDYIYLLIEYEYEDPITQKIQLVGTTIRFANAGVEFPGLSASAPCVIGFINLPNIHYGSEVKVKYIFMEEGKLDKRFDLDGIYWALPNEGKLNYKPDVVPPLPAGSWQEVGSGSASGEGVSSTDGGSEHPSLAIAPDGKAYVTWQERNSTETVFSIYTKRWNGSAWEEVGTVSASGTGISIGLESNWVPDIAISSTGVPYIAWHSTDSGNVEIYIRKWDGSSWVEVGAGSASGGGISNNSSDSVFASVAIAPDGTPYVAYHDSGDGDSEIYVKRWNGNSWAEVGVGSASGGGISKNEGASRYPALAISSGGTPYITWQDESSGDTEIYVRQWNGSSWVEVGAGSAVGGGISNNIDYSGKPSIATAQDGNPYITWDDSSNGVSQIYVRRWNGSSWVEVGTNSAIGDGISNNSDYSYSPTIAIGPDNIPYIAWYDFSGGNDTEIYVRRWNGISWVETNTGSASGEGISDDEQTSRSPTIAIAPDNTPYIAWYDGFEEVAEIFIKRWVE